MFQGNVPSVSCGYAHLPLTSGFRGRFLWVGRIGKKAPRERDWIWAPPLPVTDVSNMAAPQDVHVRICNQEIVKFDLEVKALIQVLIFGIFLESSSPQVSLVSSELSSFPLELSPGHWLRLKASHSVPVWSSLVFISPSGCFLLRHLYNP